MTRRTDAKETDMRMRSLPFVDLVFAVTLASACDGGVGGSTPDARAGNDGGVVRDGASDPDGGEGDPDGGMIIEEGLASWCDPGTFGGSVPDATTDVTIAATETVLVDCDATARTISIEAGGTLVASRARSSTLTLHGNLVVRGELNYGMPSDRVRAGVQAEIVFEGLDDERTVGLVSDFDGDGSQDGPPPALEVLDTDVGIWVIDGGRFTAAGQLKRAWAKLVDGAGPGDAVFTVESAMGWEASDRIVLSPTEPTSVPGYSEHFDEREVASVDGGTVTLSEAPEYVHDGCTDCLRRGEAANLTRNVVVRSADDSAHAHIMVAGEGVLQLDSAELRWLGPERNGGPSRRSPVYFYRQRGASERSFIRHAAIWGGQAGFVHSEASDGIEITDVAGYDAAGNGLAGGFSIFDPWECDHEPECTYGTPRGVLLTDVLAARVYPRKREDGSRVSYLVHGFAVGGGTGTGCVRCVATGMQGPDSAGYFWNNNVHLPVGPDQRFEECVSHDNGDNGIRLWQNSGTLTPPWIDVEVWSNQVGLFEGAYGNAYQFGNITIVDSAIESAVLQAVPLAEEDVVVTRFDGARMGSMRISGYVITQSNDQTFRDVTFDGTDPLAVSQDHSPCEGGDENDPDDHECIRNWVRFENPHFPDGVRPFDFGWQANFHVVWEIRGFDSADADYAALPADFDLHRADNRVAGGSYYAPFDAWLVPR
jgi:hypothetical protein